MTRHLPTAAVLATAAALFLVPAAPASAPVGALVPGFTPTPTPVSPAGTRAVIDLPASEHVRNVGSAVDGQGLCVPTSLTHSARWQAVRQLDGYREWTRGRPGGSFPQKTAADIAEYCRLKGVTPPRYVMATGDGAARLLAWAIDTRRCPAITHTAAHMVSGMHLDQSAGAILDNNDPGRWEWADRPLYLDVMARGPRGTRYGWVVVFLDPPPPPAADPSAAPAPAPPGPVRPAPRRPRWERVELAGGAVLHKVYAGGGRLLGTHQADGWHPAVGPDAWTIDPQGAPPGGSVDALPGGVDAGRADLSREAYWLDGVEVTYPALCESLGQCPDGRCPVRPQPRPVQPDPRPQPPQLPDDGGRYHLTVAGPGRDVDLVELRAELAKLPGADRAHVQAYGPEDWPVRSGRVKPGVTVQTPARLGGKVVFRSAEVTAAAVAEALMFCDPNYKPAPPEAPAPRPVTPPAPPPAVAPAAPRAAAPGCPPGCQCKGCPRPPAPAPCSDPIDSAAAIAAAVVVWLKRREVK